MRPFPSRSPRSYSSRSKYLPHSSCRSRPCTCPPHARLQPRLPPSPPLLFCILIPNPAKGAADPRRCWAPLQRNYARSSRLCFFSRLALPPLHASARGAEQPAVFSLRRAARRCRCPRLFRQPLPHSTPQHLVWWLGQPCLPTSPLASNPTHHFIVWPARPTRLFSPHSCPLAPTLPRTPRRSLLSAIPLSR